MPFMVMEDHADPSEIALEGLSRKALLVVLAQMIAKFPCKQRTALLIDLANLSDVSDESDSLQAAFLEVGIRLYDYRCTLPAEPSERGKHSALLSTAYKRLKHTFRSNWNN
jgi:hypothetical protein